MTHFSPYGEIFHYAFGKPGVNGGTEWGWALYHFGQPEETSGAVRSLVWDGSVL